MNDSVRKLVTILEPLIEDLEYQKKVLADKKDELENVSRLVAYTKDNIEMVGIYADQDLITSNLYKLGCSLEDYKASCYLLKGESDAVKSLPQYEKSHELINDIVEYFKFFKAELIVTIQELSDTCERKELEKKYYDILSRSNPFVEDVKEFIKFMDDHNLDNGDKINILYSTISSNIVNYS